MDSVLNSALVVVSLVVAVPTLFLSLQLIAAGSGSTKRERARGQQVPEFAVIIPAHDEEAVIGSTLDALKSEIEDPERILVVADNCSDGTVSVAHGRGVSVIERVDDSERGKGYALEFGVRHLLSRSAPPPFVVFMDADCLVEPNAIGILIGQCVDTGSPVQALYYMKNAGRPRIGQKVAEFAWIVKNRVRPLGLMRLGLPCQLMGTGMAFPVDLLKQLKLGTPDIVEDMKLGIDCAVLGFHPEFCPAAVVVSSFPEDRESAKSQRVRWEHGHLGMMLYGISRLSKAAFHKKDVKCLALALDLAIPPLAFLTLVLLMLFLVSALVYWTGHGGLVAMLVLSSSVLILGAALLAAWYRFARDVISPGELLWIPVYVFSKVPIYAKYWLKRQVDWVRTGRS